MTKEPLKIYFAGDLFDAKDLGGNLLLADAIEKCSGGRWSIMLPQDGECETTARTTENIRDTDFELLFNCDVILANFDGTDLDSGTVTEFCFAKMVDMPALLLRSDFRDSGDHTLPDNEPWNLMCSHYPRTEMCLVNSMVLYHKCKQECSDSRTLLEKYYSQIASSVIMALDKATAAGSWLKEDELSNQYDRAVKSIGGNIKELLPPEKLHKIISGKIKSGLYR